MERFFHSGLRSAGWILFALIFVYPCLAGVECLVRDGMPLDGTELTGPRIWGLLGRSAWMSAAATAISLLFSLPWAFLLARSEGSASRPVHGSLLAFILLCPPMVYSFGWDRILPRGVDPYLLCVLLWSLWTMPIPAWIVATGWSRCGRRAYEAALLSASPSRAFWHAAVPSLRRHLFLSVAVVWTLLFGDYAVPHACGLVVYATELFNRASNTRSLAEVLVPAWPGCAGVMALLCLTAIEARRRTDEMEPIVLTPQRVAGASWATAVTALVAVGLPAVGLFLRMGDMRAVPQALTVYGFDLGASVAVALLAGVISVAIGLGTVRRGKAGNAVVLITVLFGAMPGALIGSLLIAAFDHSAFDRLYGHWPMMLIGYVARFGWIGVLSAAVLSSMRNSELAAQAEVDGLAACDLTGRLFASLHAPLLLAAVAVIAVLSLAEVPCTSLVLSPSFKPIAYVLIEKFHKFEDGMLVALSLCLMLPVLPAAGCVWVALRRRS